MFDHAEWVLGGSNYAVASLSNANGAHQKNVLINLSDSTVKTLVEGEEIWHPCLWHSKNNYNSKDLDTDSAGVYYLSSAFYSALELRVKMQRFWEKRDSITAVALGSSRTMFALYDKNIKSHYLLNMGFSNAQMTGMSYLFVNYVLNHLKKLKVLVLEMSPDFLWYDGYSTWNNVVYDKVPGFKYDENHNFWVDGLLEHFLDAIKVTPRSETALMHPYNLDDFLLPVYGPRRSYAKNIIDSVKALNVILFDENKFGAHDYTGVMAYNTDHLSASGAQQFTRRLDSLLYKLKK
ncbi:hypothetical protein [Fibrobacter succinogenes]|uniref:hypothetical protein n=1 Tax=Fibrobacter succinogenes TaxID=833 RepID=UPI0026EAD5B4|nr:hypothetical protein [Fibrobacter succinogenes]